MHWKLWHVMSDKWVRECRRWEAARSELLAAQDMEGESRAEEVHTVKCMLFFTEAVRLNCSRGGPLHQH